jgi:predicted metal-dependent peptidase
MSKAEELKNQIQEAVAAESQIDRKKEYEDASRAVSQALYYFIEENKFIGSMLQEMTFKINGTLPTAALAFNKKTQTFEVLFNPTFFLKWDLEQRVGILHHEILHFTNKHLLRFQNAFSDKKLAAKMNIACDMAINQYIKALPPECIDVKNFKLNDGSPFPLYRSADEYYELLENNKDANKGEMEKYEKGEGNNDSHNMWEELTEEEKKDLAQEMKKLIKRTMEKTQYDKSTIPGEIKDLLEELTVMTEQFNAKRILQDTIRKHASVSDRESSWKRPNKRFGRTAPGTTVGKLPRLNIYSDTSGSRSHTEINLDLDIINKFLKSGERTCQLGMWHTRLYLKRKHKLNQPLLKSEIESGGTVINEVIKDINKSNPDLSIILTDGYYDWDGAPPKTETIVIIVDNGTTEHPMKNIVKTLKIGNLKK